MTPFFRRIRQKLANKNKPLKYIRYAIGEIVLVVVGILIALQINTENERRKEIKKLKIAVTSIHKELVKDSLQIHQDLPNVISVAHNHNKLLKKIYASDTNLDSLIIFMKRDFGIRWYTYISYNHNSYDNLKAGDTYELMPENIKEALSEYFINSEEYVVTNQNVYQQYRIHLDFFVKRYNIIGRLHDPNYENSYLYNSTWENIDPNHFTPLVATVVAGYSILYNNAQSSLENSQQRLRDLLPLLQPYLIQDN
jgi:hypothetical protein